MRTTGRLRHRQEGFTLVELLVVVAILGVLAGVVVFSVGGINNNSALQACKTEKSILRTAEEAYGAGHANVYLPQTATQSVGDLWTAKLIGSAPTYFTVTATPSTQYTLVANAGNPAGC